MRKNHLADVLEKNGEYVKFLTIFVLFLVNFVPSSTLYFLLTISVICTIHVFVMETLDRCYERYLLSPKGYSGRRITVVINT